MLLTWRLCALFVWFGCLDCYSGCMVGLVGWVGSGWFLVVLGLFEGFIVVCGDLCWCWLVYLR